MAEATFEQKLQVLIAVELGAAHKDPDRMATAVELLIRVLGLTIATACKGDAAAMGKMLAGAESHLYQMAAEHAPLAEFLNASKAKP